MRAKRLWQQPHTIILEIPSTGTGKGPMMHPVSSITKNGKSRFLRRKRVVTVRRKNGLENYKQIWLMSLTVFGKRI